MKIFVFLLVSSYYEIARTTCWVLEAALESANRIIGTHFALGTPSQLTWLDGMVTGDIVWLAIALLGCVLFIKAKKLIMRTHENA